MQKAEYHLEKGTGRTRVCLWARYLGESLLVYLYNDNAHLGAVAVSEFDPKEKRASSSVITLLGHKDDEVAREAAHLICKQTRKPTCVIAGIHVDEITRDEIAEILVNASSVVQDYLEIKGG